MKTLSVLARAVLGAALLSTSCSKSAESKETKPVTAPAPDRVAPAPAPAHAPDVAPAGREAEPAGGSAMASKTLAETAEYVLAVNTPDDAAAGKAGKVRLTLTPKTGWHLNRDFPTRLSVEPPEGVKVAKPKLGKADAVKFSEKTGAEWAVDFTAATRGDKQFGGMFRFAVCTESTCDPKKENLAFVVNVK
jgi:hypothetical protein